MMGAARQGRGVRGCLWLLGILGGSWIAGQADTLYTVRAGDTLWGIARRFQVPLPKLLEVNGLAEDSLLHPGQRLRIPSTSAPEPSTHRERLWVRASDVVLRSLPSTQGKRLALLARGTPVEGLAKVGQWWKVRTPSGQVGYVAGWLMGSEPPAEEAPSGFVMASRAYVRQGPSLESPPLTLLPRGTKVTLVAEEGGWYRVLLKDGRQGWMHMSTLRTGHAPSPPTSGGSRIVQIALRYLGTPYRYGGSSSRGTDCSGFVVLVFRSLGISLPHSAAAQFQRGKAVAKEDLRPGDLVFFQNTYVRGISHVGLYLGEGKFIHASVRGHKVRVDSLSDPYYASHYAGARRVALE